MIRNAAVKLATDIFFNNALPSREQLPPPPAVIELEIDDVGQRVDYPSVLEAEQDRAEADEVRRHHFIQQRRQGRSEMKKF